MNGSTDVVKHGISLARDERTWVTVLKVVPAYEGDIDLTSIKNMDDVFLADGRKAISEVNRLAESEGAVIKTRLETGEIDRTIVEVAEEERCDLIIMGSQKKSFLARLFGQNIVEKVIANAPCPVFVV